jgi:hypothetical protein
MPFVHCPLNRIVTPQLLREYRSTIIHIASLDYDLKLHIYLGHPKQVKEAIADEMQEYIKYSELLSEELKKRGL